MSDKLVQLAQQEHNDPAGAKKVVAKGFDGTNYPDIKTDSSGRVETTMPNVSSATNTSVSVGTSSTAVLSANSSRRFAVIVNDSDTAIYLKLGTGAALNSGIRLNASGGALSIDQTNM